MPIDPIPALKTKLTRLKRDAAAAKGHADYPKRVEQLIELKNTIQAVEKGTPAMPRPKASKTKVERVRSAPKDQRPPKDTGKSKPKAKRGKARGRGK